MKKPCAGITLLELMVVVAVIAILAGIAHPSFMQMVHKSHRMEAMKELLSMQLKQEEQHLASGSYTTTLSQLGSPTSEYYSFSAALSGASYSLTATAKNGTMQATDSEGATSCSTLTLNKVGDKTPLVCW